MTETVKSAQAAWNAVMIDSSDNIAVALAEIAGAAKVRDGERLFSVALDDTIPMGHKFAVTSIGAGRPVLKYGQAIGTATIDIPAGRHVHVHNVASGRALAGKPAT